MRCVYFWDANPTAIKEREITMANMVESPSTPTPSNILPAVSVSLDAKFKTSLQQSNISRAKMMTIEIIMIVSLFSSVNLFIFIVVL
jgi:hypothetical protein